MEPDDGAGLKRPEQSRTVFVGDALLGYPPLVDMMRSLETGEQAIHISSFEEALFELEGIGDAVVVASVNEEAAASTDFFQRARAVIQSRGGVGVFIGLVDGREHRPQDGEVGGRAIDDRLPIPCDAEALRGRIRVAHRLAAAEREVLRIRRTMELFEAVDPLTGLYNPRHGQILLGRETAKVERNKQQLSVLIADIDNFEQVNETYGRDAGDRVLAVFAAILKYTVRNYDIIVRWGGDRFLVVCPHTDSREVRVVAERLMQNIRRMEVRPREETVIQITASLGTCSSDILEPHDGLETAAALVAEADRMMQAAKFNGRDRTMHYVFSKPPNHP